MKNDIVHEYRFFNPQVTQDTRNTTECTFILDRRSTKVRQIKVVFHCFFKSNYIFPLNEIGQQITILPYFQWCQIVRDQPNR